MNLPQNDELLDHLNSTLKNIQITANKQDFSFNFGSKDNQFYLQRIKPVINLIIDDNLLSCSPISLLSYSNSYEEIRDVIGSGKRIFYRFKYDIKGNPVSHLFADFVITLYDHDEYFSLQMFLVDEPSSNFSLKLHSLAPFWIKDGQLSINGKLPHQNDITFLEQGFQSWSYNRTRTYEENYEEIEVDILARIHQNMDLWIPSKYRSESVTAITDCKSKASIVLGFCTLKDNFSQIVMNPLSNNSELEFLTCYSQFDGIVLNDIKMKPVCSELLLVQFCKKNEGYPSLRKYAQVTRKKMQARVSDPRIGWCSWYYYYEEITNDELLANVEFFTKHPNLPLDTIQLDDGYFTTIGDFTHFNDKFPAGLVEFVQKVHGQKKLAGLWIAPFFAAENSNLFKIHPEWFIRSKIDKELIPVCYNWNNLEYALDLTIPEVQEHIKSLIHIIINKWKFDFIKIDFVYASSVYTSNYSEQGLTRAQVYRKGIELIRDSMGEKFLLGCGAPLGPSIGIVDAMRVSEDTKEIWDTGNNPVWGDPCLKYALLGTIYRSFMHKALWDNDPDCLMVRDEKSDLTDNEIKLQVTIFGLSGGQVLLSDKMSELSNEKLSLIQKLIPPFSETAIPVDVLYNPLPSLYILKTSLLGVKRSLLAIINWSNQSLRRNVQFSKDIVDTKEFIVFDWWNKKILGKFTQDEVLTGLEIPIHGCRYLGIISVDKIIDYPIVLSSTLHITQGCNEIKKISLIENSITVNISQRGYHEGEIFILFPVKTKIMDSNKKFRNLRTSWGLFCIFSVQMTDSGSLQVNYQKE